MAEFDAALDALDAKLADAEKAAKALVATLRRARTQAREGQAHALADALDAIAQRGAEAGSAAQALGGAWRFDLAGYLSGGGLLADLEEAARVEGVELIVRDGQVYCFPVLLRVAAGDGAVRISGKLERRLRPRVLAALLAKMQKRKQRFNEAAFLALLHKAYRRIAHAPGDVVRLADIHETLTLMPGIEYPSDEFGRDLLLLARKPDLRTSDGARPEFPGATLTKGGARRFIAHDEHGVQHQFVGLKFVKES